MTQIVSKDKPDLHQEQLNRINSMTESVWPSSTMPIVGGIPFAPDPMDDARRVLSGELIPHGEQVRQFPTGATRNPSTNKTNPAKALSPLVLQRYAEYMAAQRIQKDGTRRADDNWQKGMPLDSFMESGMRHFMHWWTLHQGNGCKSEDDGHEVDVEEACCALMFNVMGYLHEVVKARQANGA